MASAQTHPEVTGVGFRHCPVCGRKLRGDGDLLQKYDSEHINAHNHVEAQWMLVPCGHSPREIAWDLHNAELERREWFRRERPGETDLSGLEPWPGLPSAEGAAEQKVAYLAGPVSGQIERAKIEFEAAERWLAGRGYLVLNPLKRANNPLAEEEERLHGKEAAGRMHWQRVMRQCVTDVAAADEVWVLPGWRQSTGAKFEVFIAMWLGIPIYELSHPQQARLRTWRLVPAAELERLKTAVAFCA